MKEKQYKIIAFVKENNLDVHVRLQGSFIECKGEPTYLKEVEKVFGGVLFNEYLTI